MNKYGNIKMAQVDERPWKIHPVWRGIGCLLLLLVPIMAYAASDLIITSNNAERWLPVPAELYQYIDLNAAANRIGDFLPGAASILPRLGRIYYLDLLVYVACLLLGFGIISVLYAIFYSLSGGNRKGPYYVPPVKRSPKRRSF